MKKKFIQWLLPALLLSGSQLSFAQIDTSKSSLSFSGYADAYYSYDFNKPEDHNRPSFFYSQNRSNEFNIDLAFAKAAYTTERVRANVAFAAGTYINANYASEPAALKNIYEANAGLKLCSKKNLWLDAGIFASHIGFESAISKDCWNITRSILAENTPFYESGVKLTYTSDNSKWLLCGLVLNGWQHIQRPSGNNTPAFGTQLTFTPNAKITLNYSTFIGNDKPDTAKQMRYYHNFYGIFAITDWFHLTAGFDYGMEAKADSANDFNNLYSPVVIVQLNFNDQWCVSARGEYYVDEKGILIATGTEHGFETTGYSLNVDYKIRDNAVWRIEGRTLTSKDKIFVKDNKAVNTDTFVTTSLAISF